MTFSPANKTLLTIPFILYEKITQKNCIQNKVSPNNGILLKSVLRSKLLNIPLASCFLINLDLPHRAHFDYHVLPFLVFELMDLCFLYFFTL